MRIAAVIVVFIALLGACGQDAPNAIPNVRLGMAPRDVRDRFLAGSADAGAWQTALGKADDTALEWSSQDPKASLSTARFEFHNAMLVAIRAKSNEKVAKEEISTTPRTVTVKAPAEGGSTIVVLARDCPTHKDEADAFVARAH